MKSTGIYSRILIMFMVTGIILILFFSVLYFFKNKQENLMIKESQIQFSAEVNALITLKTATLKQVVYDYTFWDEFVKNLKTNDTAWYSDNITSLLKSYRVDYVCVYDTSFNIVHEASSDGFVSHGFIPREVLLSLREKKFLDFFQTTSDGLIQISAASVHPTNDPSHSLTKPSGYMFLANRWNQDFLLGLESLCGARINILLPSDSVTKLSLTAISAIQKLPGWDGRPVARIAFNRTSNAYALYHKMSVYMALIILGSFLTTFLIFHFTTRKWINKPLKLVTSILKTGDPALTSQLQRCIGEFGDIGILFGEFIRQKDELRLAKDKAEESNRLKTAFLNNVSHEIRTPFNGILGFLPILQSEGLTDEEKQQYISIINQSAFRLMNTIDDILEISQIQSGQTELTLTEINIGKLLDELSGRFKPDAENKGLKFTVSKGAPGNMECTTDGIKLNSILSNLINNAIKFTKTGSVELGYLLTGSTTSTSGSKTVSPSVGPPAIQFFIKDTGIGIPENMREAVFEKFMQADVSSTRPFDGSGLGLSIAKAYVEMLGGKIWFESEFGKGTVFYFTIPYQARPEGEIIP